MGRNRSLLRLPLRLVLPIAALALSLPAQGQSTAQGSRVRIDHDRVLMIDDQKVFPIGFTMPPPPESTAPSGRNAIEELMEFCVREAGRDLFIIACKREGPTLEVEFSGLPAWARGGQVLFEAPRTVSASGGVFRDWFGPFEVHVYRFRNASD